MLFLGKVSVAIQNDKNIINVQNGDAVLLESSELDKDLFSIDVANDEITLSRRITNLSFSFYCSPKDFILLINRVFNTQIHSTNYALLSVPLQVPCYGLLHLLCLF